MSFKTRGTLRALLILLCSSCSLPVDAQLGFGAGWAYGTAMFVNDPVFIRRPSSAITAELSYAPPQSRIFPSFSYLLKTMTIPVRNSYFKDMDGSAKDQHYILKLNYRMSEKQYYHLLFLGIGVAHIVPDRYFSDKFSNPVAVIDTGNTHLFPIIQAGVQYMRRILPNSGFYLGFEADVQYIYMHAKNSYYLHQDNILVAAGIGGDVIFPGIALKLQYVFDRRKEWDE